jgi:hypothetical protein
MKVPHVPDPETVSTYPVNKSSLLITQEAERVANKRNDPSGEVSTAYALAIVLTPKGPFVFAH